MNPPLGKEENEIAKNEYTWDTHFLISLWVRLMITPRCILNVWFYGRKTLPSFGIAIFGGCTEIILMAYRVPVRYPFFQPETFCSSCRICDFWQTIVSIVAIMIQVVSWFLHCNVFLRTWITVHLPKIQIIDSLFQNVDSTVSNIMSLVSVFLFWAKWGACMLSICFAFAAVHSAGILMAENRWANYFRSGCYRDRITKCAYRLACVCPHNVRANRNNKIPTICQ